MLSHRAGPRGFTLIEVLMTLLVIMIVVGIIVPVVLRSRDKAKRARVASDLQAIATGLEAYHADFNEYPGVYAGDPTVAPATYFGTTGAHVLCQAMVGPGDDVGPGQDGFKGYGFKVRAGSPPKGPYLQPDKFIIDDDSDRMTPIQYQYATIRISDGENETPILYFPAAARRPNLSSNKLFLSSRAFDPPTPVTAISLYQADDNLRFFADKANIYAGPLSPAQSTLALQRIRIMLGDLNLDGNCFNEDVNGDGVLNAGEDKNGNSLLDVESPITSPFLLWTAGKDGQFGPTTATKKDVVVCDDVTNFTFAP
jgi:prepilin-type N-terminal cleavage/methylation domain-containing protein